MSTITMTNSQLADWLANLDSHSIYDADMLTELPPDLAEAVPVRTARQTVAQIERRGLGGELRANPADRLCNGWEIAEAVTRKRLGHDPGARFQGRGSVFRACVAALRCAS